MVCIPVMFHVFYYYSVKGVENGLEDLTVTLTELIFQIVCHSYHLTSRRRSALMQVSSQIPIVFHQYGKADKIKVLPRNVSAIKSVALGP